MKPFYVVLCITLIASGCATQEKARQMEQYRMQTNKVLREEDVLAAIQQIALRDPEFAAVTKAREQAIGAGVPTAAPRLIKSVAPVYPFKKRVQWREAYMHFVLIVDKTGKVRSLKYVPYPEIVVDPEFIAAGERAVWMWEFTPAMIAGKPCEAAITLPMVFDLN